MQLESKLQLNYKSLLLIILSFLFIVGLHAKIETITVNTSGTGSTEALAIEAALVQAVSQVNGAEIAANTKTSISEISSSTKGTELNEEYQNQVSTKTKGLIKSLSPLCQYPTQLTKDLVKQMVKQLEDEGKATSDYQQQSWSTSSIDWHWY